jgi:hypothetical protein
MPDSRTTVGVSFHFTFYIYQVSIGKYFQLSDRMLCSSVCNQLLYIYASEDFIGSCDTPVCTCTCTYMYGQPNRKVQSSGNDVMRKRERRWGN